MKPKKLILLFVVVLTGGLLSFGVLGGCSHEEHGNDHAEHSTTTYDHESHGDLEGHDDHESHNEHEGHDEHDEQRENNLIQLSQAELEEFDIKLNTAGPGKIQIQVNLPGEIITNPDKLVHIVPRVSGIVQDVHKKLGDPVQAGDVMAVIESRELADIKVVYLAGLQRLELAQANFAREENLWKNKISSEQDYLDTKQALAEVKIELHSAEQKLHALGFTHDYLKELPDLPDISLTRFEIIAPFNGTVIDKHITLGEKLANGAIVFTVADLSSVWAYLTVYQKDLSSVQAGQQVVIRASQNGAKATGIIDYVSPIVDEATRTATARVVLNNIKGHWRPGMFVTSQVSILDVEAGVVIPRTALQTLEDQTVVFVQNSEGFKPQLVQIGHTDSLSVEILSGLTSGQRYVISNPFTLKAELGKGSLSGGHSH